MERKIVNAQSEKKIKIIMLVVALMVLLTISIILVRLNKNKQMKEYAGVVVAKEMDLDKITLVESSDETPIQVPVPKGYVASSVEDERTVKGGFVIYEGEEAVTEENLETAKRTRNQWVWIPVKDVTEMYWKEAETGQIFGAKYTFSETGYTRETREWCEPGVLSDYDKKSAYLSTYLDGITKQEFEEELQQRFYEMIESVATYGGFYIGRYETGDLYNKIPAVRKMNGNISQMNWYQIYRNTKRIGASNANVDTNLIWQIQRDEVIKYILDSGNKTNSQIVDATSWGNFKNAEFEYEDASGTTVIKREGEEKKIPTGSSEYAKTNNIYDFAGNVWEWSMARIRNIDNRSLLGGAYYRHGDNFLFENNEAFSPWGATEYLGSRATLYIK